MKPMAIRHIVTSDDARVSPNTNADLSPNHCLLVATSISKKFRSGMWFPTLGHPPKLSLLWVNYWLVGA